MRAGSGPTGRPLHRDPANQCFGCGLANPHGLRLHFRPAGDDPLQAEARVRIPKRFLGAPHMLHGGIVATLLDETMSKVNALRGDLGVTVELRVTYRRPVPPSTPLVLRGWRRSRRRQVLTNEAEVRDAEGQVLARATGRFRILTREVVQRLGKAR